MNKRRVINRFANSEGGYVYYHEICEEIRELFAESAVTH